MSKRALMTAVLAGATLNAAPAPAPAAEPTGGTSAPSGSKQQVAPSKIDATGGTSAAFKVAPAHRKPRPAKRKSAVKAADGGPAESPGGDLAPIPVPLTGTPTVAGNVATLLPNGRAAAPRNAPKRVQAAMAAANRIIGKPYKWGGGHAKLNDTGYDCSGAVSFALIGGGLLTSPLTSGDFARWQAPGFGHWISVFANAAHVYMEIAGLRLDTSRLGDPAALPGVRWRPVLGKRPQFTTRHPTGN
jgi:cell wall-associated NlpC family hydrolase